MKVERLALLRADRALRTFEGCTVVATIFFAQLDVDSPSDGEKKKEDGRFIIAE